MRYWTSSLVARLITNFLAISAIGLSLTTIVAYRIIRSALAQSVYDRLENLVTLKEGEINRWVNGLQDDVATIPEDPQIRLYIQRLAASTSNSPAFNSAHDQLAELLLAELNDSPSIDELFILSNTGGTVLVSTSPENEGQSRLDQKYYSQGRMDLFVQNFYTSSQTGESTITIATPARDLDGNLLAVIAAQIDLAELDPLILEHTGLGNSGVMYLVDPTLSVISAGRLDVTSLTEETTTQAVDTALKGLDGFGLYMNNEGTPVVGVYHWVDNRDVAMIAEINQQEAFAPAQRSAATILIAGLLVGAVLIVATYLLARQIARPVLAISKAAEQVATGNLSVSAPVMTRDEIGTLAATFNNMAVQLRELVGGLEQRVSERTSQLVETSRLSERRAKDLQAVSDVARAASTEQNLENLFKLVTQLVSDRFGFYHVGIFMIDDSHRYAVLRAANSQGGQKMLTAGHKLEVGQVGIVGDVAASGKPRIALDVGRDAIFFSNPYLPETHSEVAIPFRAAGELIGVLDVQSKEVNAFSHENVEVLSTLADQIAVAIQNAQSLMETRKLLSEAQSSIGGYTRESWRMLQSPGRLIGYQLSGSSLKSLEKPLDDPEFDRAITQGETILSQAPGKISQLIIPIRLRGQVIGALTLRLPHERQWSDDEIDLAKAVVERLSLAFETATLMQATQYRANLERVTTEITGRISSSTRVESILQIAAQELSRVLGGSEVLVQVESPIAELAASPDS